MASSQRPFPGCNLFLGPENIFAFCDGSICVNAAENRAAAADFSIINDHKSAKIWHAIVIIDDEWAASLNRKPANLVALQLFARVACLLERGRIDHLLDGDDLTFHLLRGQTKVVKMSDPQRFACYPKQVRMKAVCLDRSFVLVRSDIAALDKNLFAKRDANRITCHAGSVRRHVPTLDAGDHRRLVCRRGYQFVPDPEFSGFDPARYDSTSVKTIHILNTEPQGKINIALLRLQEVECLENVRGAVPFHFHARPSDVFPLLRRRRNKRERV